MNETLLLIVALIAGIALGIIFFAGLWLTVKKAVTAKVPAFYLSCWYCIVWILFCRCRKLATSC